MGKAPSPPITSDNTHGYSGKPLWQKLGLKPGMTCLPIGAPDHYFDLVSGVEGVVFRKQSKAVDIVHLFCKNKKTFVEKIETSLRKVSAGGMLWVSWPKKTSPLFQDLTENDLRSFILPLTIDNERWVDVKVCAVDQDWSGLKFMRRRSS